MIYREQWRFNGQLRMVKWAPLFIITLLELVIMFGISPSKLLSPNLKVTKQTFPIVRIKLFRVFKFICFFLILPLQYIIDSSMMYLKSWRYVQYEIIRIFFVLYKIFSSKFTWEIERYEYFLMHQACDCLDSKIGLFFHRL